MAEGPLRDQSGDQFEVFSVGTRPVKVMAELGIDISVHRSKSVDEFTGAQFDQQEKQVDVCRQMLPKLLPETSQAWIRVESHRKWDSTVVSKD